MISQRGGVGSELNDGVVLRVMKYPKFKAGDDHVYPLPSALEPSGKDRAAAAGGGKIAISAWDDALTTAQQAIEIRRLAASGSGDADLGELAAYCFDVAMILSFKSAPEGDRLRAFYDGSCTAPMPAARGHVALEGFDRRSGGDRKQWLALLTDISKRAHLALIG